MADDRTLRQLLASVGVTDKPHNRDFCRELFRNGASLGPHTWDEAYALYLASNAA